MNTNTHRKGNWFLVLSILGAALGVPAFAEEEKPRGDGAGPEGTVARVYRVQYLNPQDAVMIAQQICLAEAGEANCEYRFAGRNWFTFYSTEAIHQKIETEIARLDIAPPSLNFRLSLLMAGDSDRPDPELPGGERQALEDLRQFLPYKGYRLIDSGWIRSRETADLRLGNQPPFQMSMRFHWDFASGTREFLVERFVLRRAGYQKETGGDIRQIDPKELLRSSFAMKVGETVVVGTSKLNGNNEALVILLTAEE